MRKVSENVAVTRKFVTPKTVIMKPPFLSGVAIYGFLRIKSKSFKENSALVKNKPFSFPPRVGQLHTFSKTRMGF